MKRMTPETRRKQILNTGIRLAESENYSTVSKAAIAAEIGCATSLISHYYPKVVDLRKDILQEAVRQLRAWPPWKCGQLATDH